MSGPAYFQIFRDALIISLSSKQKRLFYSCRFTGYFPLFILIPRRKVQLHPETQSHFLQNILDLIQRLPAKIFGFKHFRLSLLNELSN
jgi:hypothetical protein